MCHIQKRVKIKLYVIRFVITVNFQTQYVKTLSQPALQRWCLISKDYTYLTFLSSILSLHVALPILKMCLILKRVKVTLCIIRFVITVNFQTQYVKSLSQPVQRWCLISKDYRNIFCTGRLCYSLSLVLSSSDISGCNALQLQGLETFS